MRNGRRKIQFLYMAHMWKHIVAVILLISVVMITISCASQKKDVQKIEEMVMNNLSIETRAVSESFHVPDIQVTQLGSAQDLFFAIQNALYSFDDTFYVKTDTYEVFTGYWDLLYSSSVLHSAFQMNTVSMTYYDGTPCVIEIHFQYNDTGKVLQHFVTESKEPYENMSQQELGKKLFDIQEEIIFSSMTDTEKVIAIHDYLVRNCVYTESSDDEEDEYLASAYSVLIEGRGQCQGYSEAFVALCIISNIPARVISGTTDLADELVAHAWNQVMIDGIWYHVDVTWDDPIPDMGDYVTRAYLLKSDTYFADTHDWSSYFQYCSYDLDYDNDPY